MAPFMVALTLLPRCVAPLVQVAPATLKGACTCGKVLAPSAQLLGSSGLEINKNKGFRLEINKNKNHGNHGNLKNTAKSLKNGGS